MLAVRERHAAPFIAKADILGTEAAALYADMAFMSASGVVPQPQRYSDLAQRYGRVVWVYASVSRKAMDVSTVPVRAVKRTSDTTVEDLARAHPLRRLLQRANPFWTWPDLVEATSANLDLVGNAYWLKFADGRGVVRELWPMRPDLVEIIASPENYIAGYRVMGYDRPYTFGPDQVIHFREYNPFNDYYGLGALTACYSSSILEEEAQVWNRALMRNAGRMDGMLISDQAVSPAQARQGAAEFRELFAGPRHAGRVGVFGKGLKYQAIAASPKELDFILSRKLTREEIMAAIGMRPVILGLETGDIGRRSEQIRDYFYSTVGGRIKRIVSTANEFLVPEFGKDLELLADIETAILPYEDRLALAQADASDVQNRILLPNEVRRRRGLAPVAGGDTVFVSIAQIPIGQSGEVLDTIYNAGRLPARKDVDPRDQLWEAFVAKAQPLERAFRAAAANALTASGEAMAELVRTGHQVASVVTEGMAVLRQLLQQVAIAQLPTALEAGFAQALARVNALIAGQARMRKDPVQIAIAFDVEIPELARYLGERPLLYSDLVAASLAPDFRQLLAQQAQAGADVAAMARAVTEHMAVLAPARATLIARTEVIAAANLAQTVAFDQSGVVEKQEWLSARDERVRESHAVADGDVVPLGGLFTVGGAQLRYPGDPAGPPEEILNCRCTILPVVVTEPVV